MPGGETAKLKQVGEKVEIKGARVTGRGSQSQFVKKPPQNMRGGVLNPGLRKNPYVSLDDALKTMAPTVDHVRRSVVEAGMQADAVVRAAANAMTFGYADKAQAYLDATWEGGPRSFDQRYRAQLAEEAARNAYDFQHRRAAQTVGQVAGVTAPMLLPGAGPSAVIRAAARVVEAGDKVQKAARIAEAVGITGREAASALGAGAAVGAGMQGVGDIVRGRISSPGDYLGAAAGGAVGVAAMPFGVGRANAIGGAATPVLQDIFNGRPVSLQEAAEGATAGRAFGILADGVGTGVSGALSTQAKGKLGEAMGRMRSVADWKPRDPFVKKRAYVPDDPANRYMYPDGTRTELSDAGKRVVIYEDKFGPTADLSPNQRLMRETVPDDFHTNHFLPEDVGMIYSAPASLVGAQAVWGPIDPRRGR